MKTLRTPTQQPNVIVILTDDQGYGDFSCHGNPRLKTPNLDALHQRSVCFTDFHVAPVCAPTRGQLMTGIDGCRNGAYGISHGQFSIHPNIPTLADMFQKNGYRTGLFGKWHLGDYSRHLPQARGFTEAIHHRGGCIGIMDDYWNNDYFDDTYLHNGVLQQYQGYCTDIWFNESMQWIENCKKTNDPFFLYLATNGDHVPLYVPDHYREPYRDLGIDMASFFGMIANFDGNLGRFIHFLKEKNLYENTILVFLTDNGGTIATPFYNAGMREGKGSLYDGGHRVPCFLSWPQQFERPQEIPQLTVVQDILPTLAELCDFTMTDDVDGESVVPLLRGEKPELFEQRMSVVQRSDTESGTIRYGNGTVLWNRYRLVNGNELYDITRDLAQKNDLYKDHPQIVKKMKTHYETWWSGLNPYAEPISLGVDDRTVRLVPCDTIQHPPHYWQWHVLHGDAIDGGHWNLSIEKQGMYTIRLQRYPEECGAGLCESVPEFIPHDTDYVKYRSRSPELCPLWQLGRLDIYDYPKGTILPIAGAELFLQGKSYTKRSGIGNSIDFSTYLHEGTTTLSARFFDSQQNNITTPYYIYISPQ